MHLLRNRTKGGVRNKEETVRKPQQMKEGPWTFRIRTRLSDGLATYDFFYSRGMMFLLHPCEYEHPATPGLSPVQARAATPLGIVSQYIPSYEGIY